MDKSLLWSAESLGTGKPGLLWRIVLPAAEPMLGRDGLGGFMLQSMRFAYSPGVFAGIVAIGALGYAVVFAMEVLRTHLLRWHPESDAPA